jgi:uroporphyrinogen-III synthase
LEETLMKGLSRIRVAAVGPVIAEALQEIGVRVDVMPEGRYFMKPLVNGLVETLGPSQV